MRVIVLTCTSPLKSSAAHGSSRQPAAACRSLPQSATACHSLPQPAAACHSLYSLLQPAAACRSLATRCRNPSLGCEITSYPSVFTNFDAIFCDISFFGAIFCDIPSDSANIFRGAPPFPQKKQAKNVQKGLRIPQIPQPAAASTACRSQAIVRLLSPTLRGVTISQLIFGFLGVIFDGESVPLRA